MTHQATLEAVRGPGSWQYHQGASDAEHVDIQPQHVQTHGTILRLAVG